MNRQKLNRLNKLAEKSETETRKRQIRRLKK